MHPLLNNKYVKFGGIGAIILIALFIFLVIINLMSSSTGLSMDDSFSAGAPSISMYNQGMSMERAADYYATSESSYYPQPTPDGYTSGLEDYETNEYQISARTKEFDQMCDALTNLKTDSQVHFKYLNTSTNNCNATFYTEDTKTNSVLNTLTAFNGVEVTRNTESVTRHKQQLESQTDIIKQQLARIESSLTAAETQLDRLNQLFNTSDDVTKLSREVTNSLQYIDQLTQKKISYTSQLNNLYQQAADLAERLEVVQFTVNINRSIAINPNQDSYKWERAWKELSDTYTETLIGLSAFFGIFLLWTLRLAIYLMVLIALARVVWKLGKLIWNKW